MFRPVAADSGGPEDFPPSPVTYSDLYREIQGIKTLMDQQALAHYSPWDADAADNFRTANADMQQIKRIIVEVLKNYDPKLWTPNI